MARRRNDAASKSTIINGSSAKGSARAALAKLKEDAHASGTGMETKIFSGSARLPEEAVGNHASGRLTIEIEISLADSAIIDISCAGISSLEEKILRSALLGKKVEQAIEDAQLQVSQRFVTVTKKALIAALQDVYRRFQKEH